MNVQMSGIAPRKALEWPLRLSVGIVVLLIVAAVPGVLFPGLYHDTPAIIASDRGSDLVTLLLFVPALAVSVFYSARGSLRGQMVWLGLVSFVLYNYVVYSFGISFTPLFLVHVALVSLSVFTLVMVIRKADTGTLTGQFSASVQHSVAERRAAGVWGFNSPIAPLHHWLDDVSDAWGESPTAAPRNRWAQLLGELPRAGEDDGL